MEEGGAEKYEEGTQTILRYESLSEILTEWKNFFYVKHGVENMTSRAELDTS